MLKGLAVYSAFEPLLNESAVVCARLSRRVQNRRFRRRRPAQGRDGHDRCAEAGASRRRDVSDTPKAAAPRGPYLIYCAIATHLPLAQAACAAWPAPTVLHKSALNILALAQLAFESTGSGGVEPTDTRARRSDLDSFWNVVRFGSVVSGSSGDGTDTASGAHVAVPLHIDAVACTTFCGQEPPALAAGTKLTTCSQGRVSRRQKCWTTSSRSTAAGRKSANWPMPTTSCCVVDTAVWPTSAQFLTSICLSPYTTSG